MENLHNKTQNVLDKKKDYFERFIKLNIYSYTKPNDERIYIGTKPTEVFSLFHGGASSPKKTTGENVFVSPDEILTDQSSLQYYQILALQDFYYNYFLPQSVTKGEDVVSKNEDIVTKEEVVSKEDVVSKHEEVGTKMYDILKEEIDFIKDNLSLIKNILTSTKKKNDERFEVVTQNLEKLQDRINSIKK